MRRLKIVQRVMRRSARPREGWIRSLRESLQMTGAQLGTRLGVSKQRVARIEKDEILGKATLNTMAQVAQAMDCDFVYWIVPKTSLEETVRNQARKIAETAVSQTSHTMALEGQTIGDRDKAELIDGMIDSILNDTSTSLWENE